MNTQFFSYAIEIERTGSITKAAHNLFMAQPNLSKAIKELEKQLGYEIFERAQAGIVPTEKGRNFLVHAKSIMEHMEEMEALGLDERADSQRLRISIPRGSYIAEGFTEFVAQLDTARGMEITIQETNSMQAISNVAYEKFDLGIIRYQSIYENYFLDFVRSNGLNHELVWEFEYLAVMSREHPLAAASSVRAEDLFHHIELSHADLIIPYVDRRSVELQEQTKAGKHIYVYDRGCQFDLLTRVPTTYMWVSPLPEVYLEQYGLVQRKCTIPNNSYKDVLIYRNEYELGELDEQFKKRLYLARDEVAYKEYK